MAKFYKCTACAHNKGCIVKVNNDGHKIIRDLDNKGYECHDCSSLGIHSKAGKLNEIAAEITEAEATAECL
jgi:hypothetical protein